MIDVVVVDDTLKEERFEKVIDKFEITDQLNPSRQCFIPRKTPSIHDDLESRHQIRRSSRSESKKKKQSETDERGEDGDEGDHCQIDHKGMLKDQTTFACQSVSDHRDLDRWWTDWILKCKLDWMG